MFGVTKGELFQTFLCICNYRAKGWSFKQIMDSINDSNAISISVIQFFAVMGFLSVSGKIERMIDDENNPIK
jgi:hypothetical protein